MQKRAWKYQKRNGDTVVHTYEATPARLATKSRADKRRRIKTQAYLADYKLARGCADCGFNAHPAAMHFHHLGDKHRSLASAKTWEAAEVEVEKCIVLCANCHAIRHAEDRDAAAASRLVADLMRGPV